MPVKFFDQIQQPSSLSDEDVQIIEQVAHFTEEYFRNPKFDVSHDFNHVMRVVRNAIHILDTENLLRAGVSEQLLNTRTVILAALLHDVGDRKYVEASELGMPLAQQELVSLGMVANDAATIQTIVDGVSYSSEIKAPGRVRQIIQEIPELAVVQDADRLDAIGAIGVGRCFSFGAAQRTRSMNLSVQHFEDKLVKLEGMMKTETGRKLAAERTKRLREFMLWWNEETQFSGPA